eukprot:491516_1
MTSLKYKDIEPTEEDTAKQSRRYIVECKRKMNLIGITFNGVNIISTCSSRAAKAFLVPSRIIRINDTVFTQNSFDKKEVFESIKFARDHPGSIFELESAEKLYQKGIHFQLNINVFSDYSVERVLSQITCPKIEAILSKICGNKTVEIYDIVIKEHCRGPIIFGFISDADYECKSILNNIKNELFPYKKLRNDISKIFQNDHGTKIFGKSIMKPMCYHEWSLEDILHFSELIDRHNGNFCKEDMETLWRMIQNKSDKQSLRKMLQITMDAYISRSYTMKMNSNVFAHRNIFIYEHQQTLWLDMLTNWFYSHNIFGDGQITLDEFKDIYSMGLKLFYYDIKHNQVIQDGNKNNNFVVYGYLKEFMYGNKLFVPKEIINVIKIYFCDIPVHVTLQQYCVGHRGN